MNKMKTTGALMIAILVFIAGLKIQAQDINFGLQSGLVVGNARVANKMDIYQDYRIFYPSYAFNVNGYIEYKISNRWGLESNPGYIRKGGIVAFGINHYTSIIDMKLDYIQLPILTNFYLIDKFFISVGLEFAYLIGSEKNLPKIGTGFVQFKENAFEVSGLMGLNYRISRKISLGLRYNHGLTKIAVLECTDGYGPVIGQSNVFNQYFQMLLKFKILG